MIDNSAITTRRYGYPNIPSDIPKATKFFGYADPATRPYIEITYTK